MLLLNSFAFSAYNIEGRHYAINVKIISEKLAIAHLRDYMESGITDPTIATVLSSVLGFTVPVANIPVTLDRLSDGAIVGEYIGPSLPEGSTRLPKGSEIKWYNISFF